MNSVQRRFSKPVFGARTIGNRSFCFQAVSAAVEECSTESRPIQQSYRCPASSDGRKLLRFSPILPHSMVVKQNTTQSYTHSDFDNTMLVNSALAVVSQSFEMLVVTPMLIENVPRLLVNQSRRSHPLVLNKTLTIGLDSFTKKFSYRRISEQATRLFTQSRRTVTLGSYESRLFDRQKINPFQCLLNHILKYLTNLFDNENLGHRVIGVHRSVPSAFHIYVDGKPVGQYSLFCQLISGIFNSHPLQLKDIIFHF